MALRVATWNINSVRHRLTLARRFAHLPSRGLRELAELEGSAAVRAFFAGAADEFIAEMDRALDHDIVHAQPEDAEESA